MSSVMNVLVAEQSILVPSDYFYAIYQVQSPPLSIFCAYLRRSIIFIKCLEESHHPARYWSQRSNFQLEPLTDNPVSWVFYSPLTSWRYSCYCWHSQSWALVFIGMLVFSRHRIYPLILFRGSCKYFFWCYYRSLGSVFIAVYTMQGYHMINITQRMPIHSHFIWLEAFHATELKEDAKIKFEVITILSFKKFKLPSTNQLRSCQCVLGLFL